MVQGAGLGAARASPSDGRFIRILRIERINRIAPSGDMAPLGGPGFLGNCRSGCIGWRTRTKLLLAYVEIECSAIV